MYTEYTLEWIEYVLKAICEKLGIDIKTITKDKISQSDLNKMQTETLLKYYAPDKN